MTRDSDKPIACDLSVESLAELRRARRHLLKVAAYVAPAIIGTLVIGRTALAQGASCGPSQCHPNGGPCGPDNCGPNPP